MGVVVFVATVFVEKRLKEEEETRQGDEREDLNKEEGGQDDTTHKGELSLSFSSFKFEERRSRSRDETSQFLSRTRPCSCERHREEEENDSGGLLGWERRSAPGVLDRALRESTSEGETEDEERHGLQRLSPEYRGSLSSWLT